MTDGVSPGVIRHSGRMDLSPAYCAEKCMVRMENAPESQLSEGHSSQAPWSAGQAAQVGRNSPPRSPRAALPTGS